MVAQKLPSSKRILCLWHPRAPLLILSTHIQTHRVKNLIKKRERERKPTLSQQLSPVCQLNGRLCDDGVCTGVCAVTTTVSSCVPLPCCVWKTLFRGSHLLPLTLPISCPIFPSMVPEPWEEGLGCRYGPFSDKHSAVSYSVHTDQLWVSAIIFIHCRNQPLC